MCVCVFVDPEHLDSGHGAVIHGVIYDKCDLHTDAWVHTHRHTDTDTDTDTHTHTQAHMHILYVYIVAITMMPWYMNRNISQH